MDSDRRHELEHNSLYRALQKFPALVWEYGAYVLLGLAILVWLTIYLNRRSESQRLAQQETAQGLYNMSELIRQAEQLRQLASFVPADSMAEQQAELLSQFETQAMLAAETESPGVRSHALRLRGDFAWTMATYPAPREPDESPDTQPSTRPSTQPAPTTRPTDIFGSLELPTTRPTVRPASEWLAEAELAYRQVVDGFPKQVNDNMASLFGLAAISEERGDFEAAREVYGRIVDRADFPDGPKAVARERQKLLRVLALHPRLAPPRPRPAPGTQPTTQPTTGPATQPAPAQPVETGVMEPEAGAAGPATRPSE